MSSRSMIGTSTISKISICSIGGKGSPLFSPSMSVSSMSITTVGTTSSSLGSSVFRSGFCSSSSTSSSSTSIITSSSSGYSIGKVSGISQSPRSICASVI